MAATLLLPEGLPIPDSRAPIGVLGAGLMGHGIAQVFALAGHEVTVLDANPAAFDAARSKVARNLELMTEYGLVTREQAEAVPSRLTFTTDLADVGRSALIIEAVTESVDVKRAVYADLAPHLSPDTLLASNTSSIPIRLMADATGRIPTASPPPTSSGPPTCVPWSRSPRAS